MAVPKGFMTTDQVAAYHGVSRGCVIKWIHAEDLAAEKVNQIWLVKESDAKQYTRRPITGRPKKEV